MMTAVLSPHGRFASNAIFMARPASTVPISQRCTNNHVGRVPRNNAIDPAVSAINALTPTLIAIWINPSASDCVSTAALNRVNELRQQRQIQHRDLGVQQIGDKTHRE